MTPTYYFGKYYREAVKLKDDTAVLLRLLLPSDKDLLIKGMEHLSARSRYYRFFTAKETLSKKDVNYFTEIDERLGYILLSRLIAAARERGILQFHANVLADNKPMLSLLRKVAPNGRAALEGNVLEFELGLADVVMDLSGH